MPETETSRIARLEQRADDFEAQLNRMLPLAASMARMEANVTHLERTTSGTRSDLLSFEDKMDKRDEERDKQVSDERRGTRNALYVLTATLGASMIGAIGVVIAAVAGGG